jgi:hypothetical protein
MNLGGISPELLTIAEQQVTKIAAETASAAAQQVANDILERLPGIVDMMVNQRLEQIMAAQQPAQPPPQLQPQPQPPAGRDAISAIIAQKLAEGLSSSGSGGGDLEKAMKYMQLGKAFAEAYTAPLQQERLNTLREINEMLRMARGLGLSPDQASQVIERKTEEL